MKAAAYSRRHIAQRLAALLGLASLPLGPWQAMAETTDVGVDDAFLEAFADTMIPETQTPGALAAGVPVRFQSLLVNWASTATRLRYAAALEALQKALDEAIGGPFSKRPLPERTAALKAYDTAAYAAPAEHSDYRDLKALIVTLYYWSEVGAEDELRYEQFPGYWDGCADLNGQPAWAH